MDNQKKIELLQKQLADVTNTIHELNHNGVSMDMRVVTANSASHKVSFPAIERGASNVLFELKDANETKSLLKTPGKW